MGITPERFKEAMEFAIKDRRGACRILSYKIGEKSATITCKLRSGKTYYLEYLKIEEDGSSCLVGYGPYR